MNLDCELAPPLQPGQRAVGSALTGEGVHAGRGLPRGLHIRPVVRLQGGGGGEEETRRMAGMLAFTLVIIIIIIIIFVECFLFCVPHARKKCFLSAPLSAGAGPPQPALLLGAVHRVRRRRGAHQGVAPHDKVRAAGALPERVCPPRQGGGACKL